MKRVMIVGQPGGGKSWLARQMGARTGLPVFHIDPVLWLPHWTPRPHEDRMRMAHDIEIQDSWIFEGGFAATWDHRLTGADHLVVLDPPFALRLWRLIKRTLRDYGRSRAEMPPNCPERFQREFWVWVWQSRHSGRAENLDLLKRAQEKVTCHHLRTRQDVAQFLKTLD